MAKKTEIVMEGYIDVLEKIKERITQEIGRASCRERV